MSTIHTCQLCGGAISVNKGVTYTGKICNCWHGPQFDLPLKIMPSGIAMEPISLRDYFAGQALMGWISNIEAMKTATDVNGLAGEGARGWVAHIMYKFADAMLIAREDKGRGEQ